MLAEERRLAQRFDLCTTTTPAEWETLKSYQTGADTDWFPNGVDVDYFCPGDESYDPSTISFIGRMDYYPNQECMLRFCQQVWPRLLSHRPTLKLLIVGAEPSYAIRRLGALEGVTVTGSVDDVRPYVRRSALMVAPEAACQNLQRLAAEGFVGKYGFFEAIASTSTPLN